MHDSFNPNSIPPELKYRPQWVPWRAEIRNGKPTKPPVNPRTGAYADATDPGTWSPFDEAVAYCEEHRLDGVGFAVTADDPYTGVDLDKCRDLVTGEIETRARDIIAELNSYTEITPSGRGVRVWVKGTLPPGGRKRRNIEMYDRDRYFTVTGHHFAGTPTTIEVRGAEIAALHGRIFAANTNGERPPWGTPNAQSDGDDERLIERALCAANGDKFRRLWEGNSGEYPSPSEADLALCDMLAFYTGGDADRVDRLFRQSGLYRSKWDERHAADGGTYGQMTITKAVAGWGAFTPASRPRPGASTAPGVEADSGTADILPTDYGNAERLAARHGRDLHYVYAWKAWLVYDGRRWATDDTGEIIRRAKDTVRAMYAEASKIAGKQERLALIAHALTSESEPRLKAMITLAASEPAIPVTPRSLDVDPWLFNCLNGTIDLRQGILRPHDRADLITKLAPVTYDPDARLPLWDAFLKTVTNGDEAQAAFLQRAAGWSLTGDVSEEKLFLGIGPGATGKSTFAEALKSTLGEYAKTADFETFIKRRDGGGPRNDIARLHGARFVVSIEVDEGKRLAEAMLKMMTGGDTVAARFLYAEAFEFRPQFKLWLMANYAPNVRDDDDAMWRRIVRVPFLHVIPREKRDPRVKATLRDPTVAGPAILAWAVRGCLTWQREGLGTSPAVDAATAAYRADMDVLKDFWADRCEFRPDAWEPSAAVWSAYIDWTRENGEKHALTRKQFTARLQARGCIAKTDRIVARDGRAEKKQTRGWTGIALKATGGPDEDDGGGGADQQNGHQQNGTPGTPGTPESEKSPYETDSPDFTDSAVPTVTRVPSFVDIAVARFGAGVIEVRPVGARPCPACNRTVLWRSSGPWTCRRCTPPKDLMVVTGWRVRVHGLWSALPPRFGGSLARARRVSVSRARG